MTLTLRALIVLFLREFKALYSACSLAFKETSKWIFATYDYGASADSDYNGRLSLGAVFTVLLVLFIAATFSQAPPPDIVIRIVLVVLMPVSLLPPAIYRLVKQLFKYFKEQIKHKKAEMEEIKLNLTGTTKHENILVRPASSKECTLVKPAKDNRPDMVDEWETREQPTPEKIRTITIQDVHDHALREKNLGPYR